MQVTKLRQVISKYFKIDERKSTIKKEIIGGLTTFLAMAYILAVQPGMMSLGTGLPYSGFYLATIISSFIGTFLMGLMANVPISLAPGMGLNAFFAFTVCGILKIPIDQALSTVLISGFLYFIIAITPARLYISKTFSKNLKLAIGVGIGIFIGFVGLQNMGLIQSDAWVKSINITSEKTIHIPISSISIKLGNLKNPLILLGIFVLILTIVLHFLKIKGAIIIAMIVGIMTMGIMKLAGVSILQGENSPFQLKDFGSQFTGLGKIFGKSYLGIFKALSNPLCYIAIFSFLYVDFFDTTGTLFSIDSTANFSKYDKKWLKKANMADAISTILGASVGSSTVTSYVESQSGISAGARTGLSAIFISFLFMFSILLFPIMKPLMPIRNVILQKGVTPYEISPITGPSLVLVGILMMMQLKEFNWKEIIDIPMLFMTVIFMTLTYSVASGISVAIITHVILNSSVGLKQFICKKMGKEFYVSDYGEMLTSDLKKTKLEGAHTNYFKRINILLIILFILSIAYFGTTILYLY